MQKKKHLVPKLRFPEFEGEWELKKINKIAEKVGSGSTPKGGVKVYTNYGIPFIRSQNVFDNQLHLDEIHISEKIHKKMSGSKVLPYDILLNITGGSIGRSCVVPSTFIEGNVNQHVSIIRLNKHSPLFLQAILSSGRGQKLIYQGMTGSGREGLNFQSIRNFKIVLPKLEEQQKIANFLTAIDTRIQSLEKKKTLLEQYKKGVMQKIFKQEIRFKDDDGKEFPAWEKKKLKDLFSRKTLKNKGSEFKYVLTNSATKGIVSQNDYFDKEIANQNNLEGYYVVDVNDFVYNPRISQSAPVGPLKRNKLSKGVMSPLYTILEPKSGNLDYFEFYFETTYWYKYMKSIANFGVRHDRMNITISDFENLPIPFPTAKEQTKIANFLSAVEKKIELTNQQIAHTKTYKKGVLQQMFV